MEKSIEALASQIAYRTMNEKGGTYNIATDETPTGVYVIGGVLSMKITYANTTSMIALTEKIEKWLSQHYYSILVTGNIGFWWHGEVLYIDAVEAIYSSPVRQIEDAARMIAQYRNELAFGYIAYDGTYTEFKTINDLENTRVYTV